MTAKTLEQEARKEGFDDGYLAGKTFAGMEIASLRAKLEAVPVEEIKRAKDALREEAYHLEKFSLCDASAVKIHRTADEIDRWLAGLEKNNNKGDL